MERKIGDYDHQNKADKLKVSLNLKQVARTVEQMNYGTHRFLSALVKIRRTKRYREENPHAKMLTDSIEAALNKGGF